MAEVVGLVASVAQLLHFSAVILNRLEEYRTAAGEFPEVFKHTKIRLDLLLKGVDKIKTSANSGLIPVDEQEALLPVIRECRAQIQLLNEIIAKTLPAPGASTVRRNLKALVSFRYDGQVEKINKVIDGYMNTLHFNSSTSQYVPTGGPPPRPTPSTTVPLRQDPNFIDRPAITNRIASKCRGPAARVALVGMGGVGKTQLAIEYSYRIRASSPDTWVFWIAADSTANIEKGFQQIAHKAKIPGWDETGPDRLRIIANWLADETQGRWLIIIDNADDMSVFVPQSSAQGKRKANASTSTNGPTQDLRDLLPQTANGSYLVTSRSKDVAYQIIGDHKDIVYVKEMDHAEAVALFKNKFEDDPDEDDAKTLVDALGCIPLAIAQAGSYLNQMKPRVTLPKYIEDIRKGDEDRAKLLEEDVYDARRDGNRSNSIIATWHISFERIRQLRPSAAQLLSLMSLFAQEGIPEALLVGRYTRDVRSRFLGGWKQRRARSRQHRGLKIVTDTNDEFDEDWSVLKSFSLIATDIDGIHFAMHGLVQFATRKWLEIRGELKAWKQRFVILMNDNYPDPSMDKKNEICRPLLPHVYAALAHQASDEIQGEWGLLLSKVTWYQERSGDPLQILERMYRRAMLVLTDNFGKNDVNTLQCAARFGNYLARNRMSEEAEVLQRRVLKARKRRLGPDHRDTLYSMDKLTDSLYKQRKRIEGDAMYEAALAIRVKSLGPEHEDTIDAMQRHVSELRGQERYKECQALCRCIFNIRKKIDNSEYDLSFCNRMTIHALSLQVCGKPEEAELIYREILNYQEKHLREDYVDHLGTVQRLAVALNEQEKFEEAEPLHRRIHEEHIKAGGKHYEASLIDLAALAWNLFKQNKLEEAEKFSRILVDESTQLLGEEHYATAAASFIRASVLRKQGRFEEALLLLHQASVVGKKRQGESHPDVKDYLREYTSLKEEMAAAAGDSKGPISSSGTGPD